MLCLITFDREVALFKHDIQEILFFDNLIIDLLRQVPDLLIVVNLVVHLLARLYLILLQFIIRIVVGNTADSDHV